MVSEPRALDPDYDAECRDKKVTSRASKIGIINQHQDLPAYFDVRLDDRKKIGSKPNPPKYGNKLPTVVITLILVH